VVRARAEDILRVPLWKQQLQSLNAAMADPDHLDADLGSQAGCVWTQPALTHSNQGALLV